MIESLRAWILQLLRVPSEPTPPAGAGELQIFRAAPNYYSYRLLLWGLGQLGALLGLVAGTVAIFFIVRETGPTGDLLFRLGELVAWGIFLVQIPFSYAVLRLDYQLRWYILSDRSLRIREGILSLREKTMTFANIQQIIVRQNPLQRLLGIADVQVRSAGGGGDASGKKQLGEPMHEAYFRGVDNAAVIRSAVRDRVRLHRDSGLGDPDELAPVHHSDATDAVEAARSVHSELRALNAVLRASG